MSNSVERGVMEVKDTLLTDEEMRFQTKYIAGALRMVRRWRRIRDEQHARSFKAGVEEGKTFGRAEVVEWIKENGHVTYGRAPLKIKWYAFNPVEWFKQLQEWGLGAGDKEQPTSSDKGITS